MKILSACVSFLIGMFIGQIIFGTTPDAYVSIISFSVLIYFFSK